MKRAAGNIGFNEIGGTMDRHNTTEKEERTANRGFREMAGDVVISSVVFLINFSGRLTVCASKSATS